jgi:flagellar M-ring protein FliF
VVRSSQTVERNASDTNGGAAAVSVANALPGGGQTGGAGNDRSTSGSTEETTNYEINKTVTTSTNDGGTVKRLSVAVVVDGTNDGKTRPAAEMTQIQALVKSAMGFDAARGDQLQVNNMPFARMDAGSAEPEEKPLLGLDSAMWFKIIEAAILCITALLIGLFVVRPLISRMFAAQNGAVNMITTMVGGSPVAGALPAPGMASAAAATAAALGGPAHAQGALPAPDGSPGAPTLTAVPRSSNIDLSQLDGQFGEKSIKKVGEVVSAHPEEALSIIRTWLHQPV